MTTKVLFMCPHSAGKSLAAATYFRAAAARLDLDVSIDVAGPEPDAVNMAPVEAELQREGFTIGWNPKLVTAADVDNADVLISIGCDPAALPTTPATVELAEWDTPFISEDLFGSLQAIHQHAEALAHQLGQ